MCLVHARVIIQIECLAKLLERYKADVLRVHPRKQLLLQDLRDADQLLNALLECVEGDQARLVAVQPSKGLASRHVFSNDFLVQNFNDLDKLLPVEFVRGVQLFGYL